MFKQEERTADTREPRGPPEPAGARGVRPTATGYAAQQAELSPRSMGPSLRIGDGTASAAPGPATTAVPAPTAPVSAPPQAAPAPVVAEFTGELQRNAYEFLRRQAYSVAWLSALQTSLGVKPTGLTDLPTVDAILARYPVTLAHDPKLKDPRAIDRQEDQNRHRVAKAMAAALKELRGTLPDPSLDTQAHATGLTSAGGSNEAGKGTPEDLAFQKHGGYGAWVSKELKWGKFLGKSVLAHPEMHGRLANATAYLRSKYPNAQSDADLANAVGVHTVISFRPTTPTFDQMYHGLGFAVDLNPHQNNWQIGAAEAKTSAQIGAKDGTWSLNKILGHANALFGTSEVRSARGMAANAVKGTTEYAYMALLRADQQLRRYRELANDRQKLEAYLASPECPESARKEGIDHWVTVMKADEQWMMDPESKLVGEPEGTKRVERPGRDVGFMDHKLETVQAMCDAGGLRWLGAGGGDSSGDLMHFDGDNMSTAAGLRSQVKAARAELKAKKVAEAKKAEPAADKT